uniref:TM7S3/TM198-like domain-containing protein n=1 Tax=Palpitomonas bilix TaxID=652834 RepID=A0A7S3D751_9EUKA|mmetsp:Transcript_24705/g.62527  ORF Transcript_24705/g.62527 Transcript_24705/m.62527 type:complete len:294 (+) Transcript_24705:19-900(+)
MDATASENFPIPDVFGANKTELQELLTHFDWITAIGCLVIGLYLGILGERVRRFSYFLLGGALFFGVGAVAVCAILINVAPNMAELDKFYVALGVSGGLGVILGFLFSCLLTVGLTLVGAAFGFYLGLLTYDFGFSHIDTSNWQEWEVYILLFAPGVVLAIAFAIIVHKIERWLCMILSSFGGAYLLVQGLSQILWKASGCDVEGEGNVTLPSVCHWAYFPNPWTLVWILDNAEGSSEANGIRTVVMGHFGVALVLGAIFLIVHHFCTGSHNKDKKKALKEREFDESLRQHLI